MHWSNNCSNPFSYGYNSPLESNCFDCPNYNGSFGKHYFCQQGYNIGNNNPKMSPVLSPINSSLMTTKYSDNTSNRISNFQTLTPSLLPSNPSKMRNDVDSQSKDGTDVSWGIMLPLSASSGNSHLNKKLHWSYDVANNNNVNCHGNGIGNNKWDWNYYFDREKCVPSTENFKNCLYSPNELNQLMTGPQPSLNKSDIVNNEINRYPISSSSSSSTVSRGVLRNVVKTSSQITNKLINNTNISNINNNVNNINTGESILPYSSLTVSKQRPINDFSIESLQQNFASNVTFPDDNDNSSAPFATSVINSAPSPSKKTWAVIVGKHEKPSCHSSGYSNFALRPSASTTSMTTTATTKREPNGPGSNMKQKTVASTDINVPNEIINNNTNINNNINHLSNVNKININDFDCNVKNAKFFVIKSYSEDDVYRSIKYQIWCSTETGNRRLDNAYQNCCAASATAGMGNVANSNNNSVGSEIPIYLFFSVNGSGHFCGVAKMASSVDYKTRASVWAQGKWKGQFRVKWIFVKDVPNTQLRHIRIETNENKPVTNSRDVTEVPFEKGRQVLKIIANFKASSSIYDDFDHYEQRELLELNQ